MWLLIFIILVVLIIIYIIYLIIVERVKSKEPIWNSGFLSTCGNCDSPYVCSEGVCLLPNGATCTSSFDCASSLCSGVCVQSTSGNVGDYCPCKSPAVCVVNKCLAGPGSYCTSNSECFNNTCQSNYCANGYPDGFIGCTTNSSCVSGSCVNNICSNGTIPGAVGSPCNCDGIPMTPCSTSTCNCETRLCTNYNVPLSSPCNDVNQCSPGLVCSNVCSFPTVPTEPPDGVCQPNFTFSNGACVSNSGFPCSTDSTCSKGSCSSVYSLFMYDDTVSQMDVGPPGIVTKMGGISLITAVTSTGLYTYSNGWNLVLPPEVDGHKLVDVAFGVSNYIGLFTDGYLYQGTSSWNAYGTVNDSSSVITTGKYLEVDSNGNLLLTTSDNKVYQRTGSYFVTGLSYSWYGVINPLNSVLRGIGPVRYYNAGIVNPGGNSPAICPANFNVDSIVSCPSSANYCFIGYDQNNNVSLLYNGSYSGIVQPSNHDLEIVNYNIGSNMSVILFTNGIYISRDNTGVIAPGYFTTNSMSAIIGGKVYVLTTSCN